MLRKKFCRLVTAPMVMALASFCLPASSSAQFTEWGSFSVPDPFSVTAVVRGLTSKSQSPEGPQPQVRFEALVGYFGGAQNQFDYHSSVALSAPETNGSGLRVVDTRNPISYSTSGVQSILNGLCCSNNGTGLADDRSVHGFTDFAAGESWEVVIGAPEFGDPPIEKRRFSIPVPKEEEKR